MKKLLFVFMLFALFTGIARAQCGPTTPAYTKVGNTITVATMGQSDIQNALNAITADGTTVMLPTGNCIWTTQLIYTQTFSFVLQGAGVTTGATTDGLSNPTGYTDNSVIQDNYSHSNNPPQDIVITTAAGKSFRMTGISMLTASGQTNVPFNGLISINGSSHSVRIDHNHMVPNLGGEGFLYAGWIYGVTDHNVMETTTGLNANFLEIRGSNWNGSSDPNGDVSWTDTAHFGSVQYMFAENNMCRTVANGPPNSNFATCFDTEEGGRIVYRYNSLVNTEVQTHGMGHDGCCSPYVSGRDRGNRAEEVYGNAFNYTYSPGGARSQSIELEGGSMLWWNNTITGFKEVIFGYVVRYTNNPYVENAPPNGWGYCGTHQTGVASVWDQNLDSTGAHCIDGIGDGEGDLLTGNTWPNVLDSVTSTQTWPNQAQEPAYVWGQTFNLPTEETPHYWSEMDTATLENRDYYLELPNVDEATTFTGTVGIGCGPAAGVGCANPVVQPTTCTAGVGYWKPVNQTLYICTAGNVWNPYYTPYIYPHPLVSGGPTWGNMDMWLQMNTSTPGTTLTGPILLAGTVSGTTFAYEICSNSGSTCPTPGPNPLYTVGASQGNMGGSITVNGTTYPNGTATQSLQLAGSGSFVWTIITGFPSVPVMVANGFFTSPPTAVPGFNAEHEDLLSMYATGGHFAVMQLQPGNVNGGENTNGIHIETDGMNPTSSCTTLESPFIVIQPSYRYSFSFSSNSTTNTAYLSIFDPANNYALVGSTTAATCVAGTFPGSEKVELGNIEEGTTPGPLYYEDVMFDWTNAIYPNFPQGGSVGSVVLSPSSNNFGLVNVGSSSSPITFTVTNNSVANATSVTPTTIGGNPTDFTIGSNTCGTVPNGGGTCTFTVTFQPSAAGSRSTTLNVSYSGGDSASPQTAPLSGTGGSVVLSPSSENFGSVSVGSSSPAVIFTLTNNSTATATSITPTNIGGNTGDFTIANSGAGSCGAAGNSIAASASCTVEVTFSPTASGSRSTTLSVSYSGGDGNAPQVSSLSGTGVTSAAVGSNMSGGAQIISGAKVQ